MDVVLILPRSALKGFRGNCFFAPLRQWRGAAFFVPILLFVTTRIRAILVDCSDSE